MNAEWATLGEIRERGIRGDLHPVINCALPKKFFIRGEGGRRFNLGMFSLPG